MSWRGGTATRLDRFRKVPGPYSDLLQNFLVAYYAAADRLRKGDLTVQFPEGCFPPGLPYVPTFSDLRLKPG